MLHLSTFVRVFPKSRFGARNFSQSLDITKNKLKFNITPQEIRDNTKKLIENGNKFVDNLVATPNPNFDNVVKKYAIWDANEDSMMSSIMFSGYVSTNPEVRKASAEAMAQLSAWGIELSTREDLFKVFEQISKNINKESLNPVDLRLLDKILIDYKRNGLALPESIKNKVKQLRTRESELQIEFQKNLNEDNTEVPYTLEDLEGLPESFIKQLKTKEINGVTHYIVTLKYPDLVPVLQNAKKENTRKSLDIVNGKRLINENTPLLEEALSIRSEIAKLMGYPNYAAFQLEQRMAKDPDTVLKFLSELQQKLTPGASKELSKLLEMKRSETEKTNQPFDGKINTWDVSYYSNKMLEKDYSVNKEEVKQYFSLPHVTTAMLELYQQILGLKFQEIKSNDLWHEDVRMFAVFDSQTNNFLGHLYLDLFPREGKYGHAAIFPLLAHYKQEDGTISRPAAAMVANFPKPTSDGPSLLDHNEVVTFFHELGHGFHVLCSTSPYKKFSGTSVEQDFVETPSQMLENWCWNKEVLNKISKHHITGKPLPGDLVDRMIASKNLNAGLFNLRQLLFGMFDMSCHVVNGKINTASLYSQLSKDVYMIETSEGTNRAATFGHIMGGYDAGYYGYMWSKVYSSDLFSVFEEKGVLNPVIGKRYRDLVLAPGYTQDGTQTLKNFLGREPRTEPFLKEIGLL